MNFDLQKTVWQRVMEGREELNAENALLPEKLAEYVQDEKTDCRTYRQLACRMTGADAAALRRLGAEEENHARMLNTAYYLLTGRTTDLTPETTVAPAKLCAALRERYLAEVSGSQSYARAAAEFPTHAALFEQLSADEARHAKTVTQLLEHNL